MELECRPGAPLRVSLGGNYAQPSITLESIPTGGTMDRLETYLGNRNCGAPYTSDEEREAEKSVEALDRNQAERGAELLLVRRYYAVRPVSVARSGGFAQSDAIFSPSSMFT